MAKRRHKALDPSTTSRTDDKIQPIESQSGELPSRPVDFGLYNDRLVIDRKQFGNLIKALTRGYTHDYHGMGLVALVQKLFQLSSWEEAKKLYETLLKEK